MKLFAGPCLLLLLSIAPSGPASGRYVITNSSWDTLGTYEGNSITLDSSVTLPSSSHSKLLASLTISPGPSSEYPAYLVQTLGNLVAYCWGVAALVPGEACDTNGSNPSMQVVIEPIAQDAEGRILDFIVFIAGGSNGPTCPAVPFGPLTLTIDGVTYEAADPCELSSENGPASPEGPESVYSSTDTGALEFVGGALVNPQNYLGVKNGSDTGWKILSSSKLKSMRTASSSGGETVAVGPNANGTTTGDPWILGFAAITGGHPIYHWESGNWILKPGAAASISVSPQGNPWIIDSAGNVSFWNGSAFERDTLAPCARWIGVGPNAYGLRYGDPWVVSCDTLSGFAVYERQSTRWVLRPASYNGFTGGAMRIAVSPQGFPWIVDGYGDVAYWTGTSFDFFDPASTPCARGIAVGPALATLLASYDGSNYDPNQGFYTAAPFRYGQAWILGCTVDANGNHPIYQFQNGTNGLYWVETGINQPVVPFTMGTQISVSPDRGVPWIYTASGNLYQ